jgi:hypothetical protein
MDRLAEIAAHNLYSLADPEVYEDLSRLPVDPEFAARLVARLPAGWSVARHAIWLAADPPATNIVSPMPAQGFKVHVSATPGQADRVLDHVVPVLAAQSVPFKVCADEWVLFLVNSKSFPRGQSGKFLTAYPPDVPAFRTLLERLHAATAGAKVLGPHILSDRRFRDSRLLFYRYGEFRPSFRVAPDGTRTSQLTAPDGTQEPDQRLPLVRFPAWVEDPFAEPAEMADDAGPPLLKNRYRIEGAFAFSNSGGVYRGTDLATGMKVAVKEARPLTNCWRIGGKVWDAVTLLGREHRTLRRLHGLDCVPQAIDLFEEGGHSFLVLSQVEGGTLDAYWAQQDMLLAPYIRRPGTIARFVPRFRSIAAEAVAMLRAVHARGVVIGDLSPRNILVARDTARLTLIDFESAIVPSEDGEAVNGYAALWGTPGFVAADRERRGTPGAHDDVVALGLTLVSAIVPANHFFALKPEAETGMLRRLIALGLPSAVGTLIEALLAGAIDDAETLLARWPNQPCVAVPAPSCTALAAVAPASAADAICEHLLGSYDAQRADRLWPAHYAVFETNPLGLAFGAAGPLLLLRRRDRTVPDEINDWIGAAPIDAERHPPGLFSGLAGMAVAFAEAGLSGPAARAMAALRDSPLRFAEPGIAHGAAGWGLAALHLNASGLAADGVALAISAGEHLLRTAEEMDGGLAWRSAADGLVHCGFGHGASGIGLFLMHLFRRTDDARFRAAALRALAGDIAHRIETEVGWQWPRWLGDGIAYPYMVHGSAGIGAVALRMARWLGDDKASGWARRIAEDTAIKYSYIPGLFEGLAGVGEFQLDMALALREERFMAAALDIAETIRWFEVSRPPGVTYPGRWLARCSADYATGAAGIGLFFARLARPGLRLLFDLPGDRW